MESLVAYLPDQPRSQGLLLPGAPAPTRDPGNEVACQMRSFSCLRTTTVRAIFHSLFCNSLQVVNKNTPPFEIETAYQVLKQITHFRLTN